MQSSHLPTITIGIPAFNEAKNIGHLFADLIVQNRTKYTISKIIVVSDASTDDTLAVVRGVSKLPISLHINPDRLGLAPSLNYIIENTSSDILLTLDADIRLSNKNFIADLISPIIAGKADYTTASIQESEPESFFAKSLWLSMQVKRNIYRCIGDGHSIYNSFGLARGYSRRMYKSLKFPVSIGNDMYSYLFAISNNYTFVHASKAKAIYFLPTSILDSSRQSQRFIQARKSMGLYFENSLVVQSLHIPFHSILNGLWISLPLIIKLPAQALTYIAYLCYTEIASLHSKIEDRWDIATTTKHE